MDYGTKEHPGRAVMQHGPLHSPWQAKLFGFIRSNVLSWYRGLTCCYSCDWDTPSSCTLLDTIAKWIATWNILLISSLLVHCSAEGWPAGLPLQKCGGDSETGPSYYAWMRWHPTFLQRFNLDILEQQWVYTLHTWHLALWQASNLSQGTPGERQASGNSQCLIRSVNLCQWCHFWCLAKVQY